MSEYMHAYLSAPNAACRTPALLSTTRGAMILSTEPCTHWRSASGLLTRWEMVVHAHSRSSALAL